MNEKLQEFMNYQARISAYYFAFSLIGYDEATVAPKGANALTATSITMNEITEIRVDMIENSAESVEIGRIPASRFAFSIFS